MYKNSSKMCHFNSGSVSNLKEENAPGTNNLKLDGKILKKYML